MPMCITLRNDEMLHLKTAAGEEIEVAIVSKTFENAKVAGVKIVVSAPQSVKISRKDWETDRHDPDRLPFRPGRR
jgi:sRNA-binding carbon storage regulator CsrA